MKCYMYYLYAIKIEYVRTYIIYFVCERIHYSNFILCVSHTIFTDRLLKIKMKYDLSLTDMMRSGGIELCWNKTIYKIQVSIYLICSNVFKIINIFIKQLLRARKVIEYKQLISRATKNVINKLLTSWLLRRHTMPLSGVLFLSEDSFVARTHTNIHIKHSRKHD